MNITDIKTLLIAARTCTHLGMCGFQAPIRNIHTGEINSSTPLNTILIEADMMTRLTLGDLLECKFTQDGSIKIGIVQYQFMRPSAIDMNQLLMKLKDGASNAVCAPNADSDKHEPNKGVHLVRTQN